LGIEQETDAMTELQENTMKPVTTDKLFEDLKAVVTDAEELLKATAGQAGDKVAAARAGPWIACRRAAGLGVAARQGRAHALLMAFVFYRNPSKKRQTGRESEGQ
jgi:hypothetical protein